MKVGSLVVYSSYTHNYDPPYVGIIIEIDLEHWQPYRVRWTTHDSTTRDWYAEEELYLLQ